MEWVRTVRTISFRGGESFKFQTVKYSATVLIGNCTVIAKRLSIGTFPIAEYLTHLIKLAGAATYQVQAL